MQFDKGYLSPLSSPMRASIGVRARRRYSWINEKKISSLKDMLRCSRRRQNRQAVADYSEDVEGEALATLVVNKLRARFKSRPSRRPASVIAAKR